MKPKIKPVTELLGMTCKSWYAHEPFRNSAVIAYYAIFSLPGLLVISINLAGYFFGQEVVINRVTDQVDAMIGNDTADSIRDIILNASRSDAQGITTILGACILLFGATGVFYQIQQTLNKLWEVRLQKNANFFKVVMDRLFSFGLVITMGFLLLISLLVSSALGAFSDWISRYISDNVHIIFQLLDYFVSFSIVILLFAFIYRFLPDAEIRWKDVWIGATVTAALFTLAKVIFSFYFGHSDPGSTYGAAGSIILIMLWVSYASLILLFGAEFTRNYADRYGKKIKPSEHGEKVPEGSQPT